MTHSFPTRRASDLLEDVQRQDQAGEQHGAEREHRHGGHGLDTTAGRSGSGLEGRQVRSVRERHQELREALLRRSEEHTSELQSLMRISYAVFCLKKKKNYTSKAIQQEHITN